MYFILFYFILTNMYLYFYFIDNIPLKSLYFLRLQYVDALYYQMKSDDAETSLSSAQIGSYQK